jgi:hypothetical protein
MPAAAEPRVEAVLRLAQQHELEQVARRLGLHERPCLAVVGGADGLAPDEVAELERLFTNDLAPLAASIGAVAVDGGTDSGVMRAMGRARARTGDSFPLVGVVPEALAHDLEPNHSHFVLVPGSDWGDGAPWLAGVATSLADGHTSATLLVNGGEVSWADAEASVAAGRPVVALAGSGRAADALAAAVGGTPPDERAARLARSGLVEIVDTASLERTLHHLLVP